jgi:hypothetical protein
VVGALVVFSVFKPAAEGVSAKVTLDRPSSEEVVPTVEMSPPDAASGAEFFNVTAWQGGGLVIEELESTGEPGVFRTSEPVPVSGSWKTIVRMSRGNTLSSMPIYLPEDPAIPAKGVPAAASFERTFIADFELLQREQKDVAGWLTVLAYAVVVVIAFALLVMIAWSLHRLALAAGTGASAREAAPERREASAIGREVTV